MFGNRFLSFLYPAQPRPGISRSGSDLGLGVNIKISSFILVCSRTGLLIAVLIASLAKIAGAAPVEVRSGLWGDLELRQIMIAPMNEVLPYGSGTTYETTWYFPGHTTSTLVRFLAGVHLSGEQERELLAPGSWLTDSNGVISIAPSDALVISLTPATRDLLYLELALSPANQRYYQPWSIPTNQLIPVLAMSELLPELQAMFKRVMYQRGDRYFVSDGPSLLNATTDPHQKILVLRLLQGSTAYAVNIRIPPDGDIDALVSYWGVMGREVRIRPILDAISRSSDAGVIDIGYVLPVFARTRLNRFPVDGLNDLVRRDCHWTSLNFFNEVPDDDLAGLTGMQKEIRNNYTKLETAPAFGDLVFFSRPDGVIIHSAVYLAGNLVFTKNGDLSTQPWIIMDMENLRQHYEIAMHEKITTNYWRHLLR